VVLLIQRRSPYNPAKIIKNILTCLEKNQSQTPSSIAKCTRINPKTAQKYIGIAHNLGILKCERVKTGKTKIQVCRINPKYKTILKDVKR
jgi:predicted transcriptional regulator